MSGGWNTIESDAGVFTSLVENFGVKQVQFEEMLMLDSEFLRTLAPVYGVIFLFKYPAKSDGLHDGTHDFAAAETLFFANQVIQNACATQAILSVLLNRRELDLGPELASFKEFTAAFPSDLRGEALSNSELIRTVHNSFARSSPFVDEGTRAATEDDDVYHFIAYTPLNGVLYELDGLQPAPISHGPCTDEEFPEKIIPVLQRRIERYPPNEIRFNLLAMVQDPRVRAREIGDFETLENEERKREAWKWENELRKHNFVGFTHEVLKMVLAEKVKDGSYESWVEDAKAKTRKRMEDRRKGGGGDEQPSHRRLTTHCIARSSELPLPSALLLFLRLALLRLRAHFRTPVPSYALAARFYARSRHLLNLLRSALKLAEPAPPPSSSSAAAFQVITLGSGGGPSEHNVSGYLVRSTSQSWAADSLLALDAGTHLAGIISILESESERDAFDTAPLPHSDPRANAIHITRDLVATFLLTHTHLDHLSGFVMNTAAFLPSGKPKTLAALPDAIEAIKNHIFNGVIWPNLSDEDDGVGLVTYQRMPVAAEYVRVAEGLSAQAWPVSHGHCMKRHAHTGRLSATNLEVAPPPRRQWCVLDSAAYFIRDDKTGQEVMMWGDVEPDTLSLDPRNAAVWSTAASKIHAGTLTTIFIECSFASSQCDEALYGHLNAHHLYSELSVLASSVSTLRLKRKRNSNGCATARSGLLRGLTVVITHVKDTLKEGEDTVRDVERDLAKLEEEGGLGLRFVMAERGLSLYF